MPPLLIPVKSTRSYDGLPLKNMIMSLCKLFLHGKLCMKMIMSVQEQGKGKRARSQSGPASEVGESDKEEDGDED
jgi:hypothetical protein